MTRKHAFGSIALVLALAGCAKTPLIQGNEAFHDGDYELARSHWVEPAQAGDADAQHNLGVLHHRLGNDALAAMWWRRAVAQEFVPSMLWLARLEVSAGRQEAAVDLYSRAARWGASEAREALAAFGAPIPRADLWLAYSRQFESRQAIVARQMDRKHLNEELYRALDEGVAKQQAADQ